jgi:OOP family OmpA-OmpF porin
MRIRYPIILCLGLFSAAQANAFDFFESNTARLGVAGGKQSLSDNSFKADSAAWNFFLGYEFNRYFAVEGGRIEGGSPNQYVLGTTDELKNYSWHVSAVGSWPFHDDVSVFARVGALSWHATETIKQGSTIQATASGTGNEPLYGAGVAINIDSGMLRFEYDRSKIAGLDMSYVSASIVWRFRL